MFRAYSLLLLLIVFTSADFLTAQPQDSIRLSYKRSDEQFLQKYNPGDKAKYFPLRGTGVWTELNPKVPRADYIGLHFINADTGWACGLWSAVIRTTDGGTNWTTCETPTGEILLKIHSYNGQVVMSVGHTGTILRSTDGGLQFTQLTGITNQELWGVRMLNDSLGWICGRNQTLLKTTNGGVSWQNVSTGYNYHYWSFDFLDENNWMIACSQGKVLKTTNGGLNWSIQQAGSTQDLYSLDIIDSMHIAGSGNYGKTIYSSDGGANWAEKQVTSAPVNSIAYFNIDTGYIAISEDVLWKTTNRGQSWSSLELTAGCWWQIQLLENGLGFSGGNALNFNKRTGGLDNWAKLFLNFNWSDVFFLNEQKGFAITSALQYYPFPYLYKTENGGLTWDSVSGAPRGNDILFLDSLTGFIGGTTLFKSTNGGLSWNTVNIPPGTISKIFFIDSQTGWALSGRSILKTTDGGDNWVTKFTHVTSVFLSIHFSDSLNGWVAGARPQKTTDGGETWIEEAYQSLWNSREVYFLAKDTGWVGLSNAVFRTINAGSSWALVPGIAGAWTFSFFPDPIHWIIWGGPYYITTDYGFNWIDFTEDAPAGLTRFSAPNNTMGFAAGNLGLIVQYLDTVYVPVELVSFTGKINENVVVLEWETSVELNVKTFEILKSPDELEWQHIGYVEPKGKGIYQFEDSQVNGNQSFYRIRIIDYNNKETYSNILRLSFSVEESFHLYQNYPNPFNNKTVIKFRVDRDEYVVLEVYNYLGEKVLELLNTLKPKGTYSILLNAEGLASGVYFYKMKINETIVCRKLVLIK